MENQYLLPDWKDKTKKEKILFILGLIFASLVVISIIITLITQHNFFYLYYTFIVVFLITQGLVYWKYNKPISIIEFFCAIIFLIAEIIMFVK